MKLFFSIIFSILFYHSPFAQWEPMGGPYGGSVNDLAQNEFYQFASTSNGLYRSEDNGKSWTRLVIGLGADYSASYMAIRENQIVVYAGSPHTGEWKNYLVKSDDYGNSWSLLNKPETPNYLTIAINGYGIYVADFTHLWVSTDQGLTWNISSVPRGTDLSQYNDQIYIGVYKTIFRSSDADEWTEIVVDGMTSAIKTFQVFDSVILVRDEYGKLLVSEDGGDTWTNSVIPSYWGAQVNFVKINDAFYGYRFNDILRSEDNGLTWDSTGTQRGINKMILVGDTIIASTSSQGILRSADSGVSFKAYNLILDAANVDAIEVEQNYLWTGCNFHGVSRQEKSTAAWDTILFPAEHLLQDIKSLEGRLFVIKGYYDIYRSEDEGASWSNVTPIAHGSGFSQLYIDGQTIRAGGPSENTPLYKSNDYRENWQPDTFRINNIPYWPSMFTKKGSILFTADRYHIFRSLDFGLSWEILNGYTGDGVITDIKASDNLLFANQESGDDVIEGSTSFSRDNGETWELLDIGFPSEYHEYGFQFETEVNNHLIVTGSWDGKGIYISSDQAISWEHFDERLSFNHINEIIADDKYLYAATSGWGVWRRKISDLPITSTDQPLAINEISIYPNPSTGNFTIKPISYYPGEATLVISDIGGKTCLTKIIHFSDETEIHTESLSAGIYFLALHSAGMAYSAKIIIQK